MTGRPYNAQAEETMRFFVLRACHATTVNGQRFAQCAGRSQVKQGEAPLRDAVSGQIRNQR